MKYINEGFQKDNNLINDLNMNFCQELNYYLKNNLNNEENNNLEIINEESIISESNINEKSIIIQKRMENSIKGKIKDEKKIINENKIYVYIPLEEKVLEFINPKSENLTEILKNLFENFNEISIENNNKIRIKKSKRSNSFYLNDKELLNESKEKNSYRKTKSTGLTLDLFKNIVKFKRLYKKNNSKH